LEHYNKEKVNYLKLGRNWKGKLKYRAWNSKFNNKRNNHKKPITEQAKHKLMTINKEYYNSNSKIKESNKNKNHKILIYKIK